MKSNDFTILSLETHPNIRIPYPGAVKFLKLKSWNLLPQKKQKFSKVHNWRTTYDKHRRQQIATGYLRDSDTVKTLWQMRQFIYNYSFVTYVGMNIFLGKVLEKNRKGKRHDRNDSTNTFLMFLAKTKFFQNFP